MICVSIADVSAAEATEMLKSLKLAELRLDRIQCTYDDFDSFFSGNAETIATCRPALGQNEDKRKDTLIQAIEKGASMIDIEVECSDHFKEEVIKAARKHSCKVIISYHNYEKTPVMRELEQILHWCFESGADIAKIACHADSAEDSARLLALYSYGRPLVSIGMGEAGKITRIAAPLLGAPFTYASAGESNKTAPGQFEHKKLEEIISMIKGKS